MTRKRAPGTQIVSRETSINTMGHSTWNKKTIKVKRHVDKAGGNLIIRCE
jgi:hypothetical protein